MTKTKSEPYATTLLVGPALGRRLWIKEKFAPNAANSPQVFLPLGSLASKKLSKLVDIWIPAFSKWESIFNGLPERLVGFGIFQIHKNAPFFTFQVPSLPGVDKHLHREIEIGS